MVQKRKNDFWNSFAKKYDGFVSKYASGAYKTMIVLIKQELSEHSKVLEVGTGTGIISFAIADKVKSIVSIDFAPEMIKIAKKKLKQSNCNNINFKIGSATNIEFPDKSFDRIIASNVFHLLSEPHKALNEICRLLTDEGKVILPTYCHGESLKTKLLSSIMSISGFKATNKWSTRQFREFLQNEGLNIQTEQIIKDKIPLSFIVASKT